MKNIYLDYAASTPVDPRALRAMEPYFAKQFGNPGSLHSFGQEAIAAIDASRETLAKILRVGFREIIFTGSATEANNLALRGALAGFRARGAHAHAKARIIVSAIEHESIIETARDLEREGAEVIYLPVDERGTVNMNALERYLDEKTAIVSVMYANNEIGCVQPIAEIAKFVNGRALFHTDAAQAFQFFTCEPGAAGPDLMTLSSHKVYGPKGAGALYIKEGALRGATLPPIITGGGQEFGLRSGTENVPAIVGFAKAAELAARARAKESVRLGVLKSRLWAGIKNGVPHAEINGSLEDSLPNILNVYVPGHSAEDMLTKLDLAGVAASSGSACRARALEASYVIEALDYSAERAKSSIRFSLGRPTTKSEIDAAVKLFKKAVVL